MFELGKETGQLAQMNEQLGAFANAFAESAELRQMLDNPLVPAKEQQALLSLITPAAPKDSEKTATKHAPLPLGFEALATEVLGWKTNKLAGAPSGPALPEKVELVRTTPRGGGESGASARLLFTPARPGALLAAARDRRMPVG